MDEDIEFTANTPGKNKTACDMLMERNSVLKLADELQVFREKIPPQWRDCLFVKRYDRDEFIKELDRSFWQDVLERSSVCAGMTDREKHKFQESMRNDPPVFNAESIVSFSKNAMKIFTEGVQHTLKIVFDQFTQTNYSPLGHRKEKVDNCRRIEKSFRCRAGLYYDPRFRSWDYRSHYNTGYYSSAPSFNDLLTAFHILDGKPAPTYASNFDFFYNEQRKAWGDTNSPEVTTPYFTVRAFKNGNQLVSITRLDLLDLLNQYGSTNQIPEALRKKYKPEHFRKEAA